MFSEYMTKFLEKYEVICEKKEKTSGIKEGAHVRYIGIDDDDVSLKHHHYCGYPFDPRGILDLGAIYEIEYLIIARSYALVQLVGFGEYKFTPSIFEAIDKNEEKKCIKEGSRVRYIGAKNDILTSGTVYEVESVLKHVSGVGYTDLILVGFEERFERGLFEKVLN